MLNLGFRGLVRRYWLINLNPYQAELWNSVHIDRQEYEDAGKLQEDGVLGSAQTDRWHHKCTASRISEAFRVRSVWKMPDLGYWWGSQSSWIWRHVFCETDTNISVEFSVFVFRRGSTFKMEPASYAVSCPRKPRTFILLVLSVVFTSEGLVFGTDTMHWGFPLNLTELRGAEWRLCRVAAAGRCCLSWSSSHEIGEAGRRGSRKTEF
jgi:hypothetical protein